MNVFSFGPLINSNNTIPDSQEIRNEIRVINQDLMAAAKSGRLELSIVLNIIH